MNSVEIKSYFSKMHLNLLLAIPRKMFAQHFQFVRNRQSTFMQTNKQSEEEEREKAEIFLGKGRVIVI